MELKLTKNYIELIDTQSKHEIYTIPRDRLVESFSENELISDWIFHLSSKAFINDNNKNCLYEIAVIIETQHPLLFNWAETFFDAEKRIYESKVFEAINKENKDEFGGLDFANIKFDIDSSVIPLLKENVLKNLKMHKLPIA